MATLQQTYEDHSCCTHTLSDEDAPLLISDEEIEAWVQEIYEKGKGSLHSPSVKKLAEHLWNAVQEGYGTKLDEVDLNSPDAVMLTHLQRNCYTFSGAKNRTQLEALTALINDNGRIREWSDYKKEAAKLNLTINKTWLKTEYDLAIAGATMASKWAQYEATPDAMLRYNTVNDARVRDSHRVLNNITRPANDSFWDTHYPPNGFRCRCDVDRIPYSAPATADDKLPPVDDTVPPMFRTNLAKDKLVFPANHPYYSNNKKTATEFTISLTKDSINKAWVNYRTDKGSLEKHTIALLQQNSDDAINWQIANELANEGNKVKVLPVINVDKPQYQWLFDRAKTNKCPDLLVNNRFVEIEGSYRYETSIYNAIKNTANAALKQADVAIVHIHYDADSKDITNAINSVKKAHSSRGRMVDIRVRNLSGVYIE